MRDVVFLSVFFIARQSIYTLYAHAIIRQTTWVITAFHVQHYELDRFISVFEKQELVLNNIIDRDRENEATAK